MTTVLSFWAEAAIRLGDRRAAARLEELFAPVTETTVYNGGTYYGSIDAFRGMLAWTLGRRDEAEALWRGALAHNDRIAAPIPNARLLHLWGELLAREGESERAGERLRESRTLAEAHRCTGFVGLVDETLAAVS
jgi:hypothetical protein